MPGGHASQPRIGGYLPDTPDEARANVRELAAVGVDGVKLTYSDQAHTGRPPLTVMRADIMQAMIAEAHANRLKAYVHAPTLRHAKEVLHRLTAHDFWLQVVDSEWVSHYSAIDSAPRPST